MKSVKRAEGFDNGNSIYILKKMETYDISKKMRIGEGICCCLDDFGKRIGQSRTRQTD